jgi:NAD(P)-dependent dehydrogenase (short-subunit alcohol dehydrogenase family)
MAGLGGVTVVVAGVGTGFGSAVAEALTEVGAQVVGVGTNLGTLVAALGMGFVPEVEPEGLGGREDLLRRHRPRFLVITEDAGGWVVAAAGLTEDAVIMTVTRDLLACRHPLVVSVLVRPDAGARLTGVSSRIAAGMGSVLVEVEVGLQVAGLVELALGRGERLAACYLLGADGLAALDQG